MQGLEVLAIVVGEVFDVDREENMDEGGACANDETRELCDGGFDGDAVGLSCTLEAQFLMRPVSVNFLLVDLISDVKLRKNSVDSVRMNIVARSKQAYCE
jgi:hypothetical protein